MKLVGAGSKSIYSDENKNVKKILIRE